MHTGFYVVLMYVIGLAYSYGVLYGRRMCKGSRDPEFEAFIQALFFPLTFLFILGRVTYKLATGYQR